MKPIRIITLTILFFSIGGFISCKKKEDKNIISGVAINQQTQQAIGGVRVELSAKEIANGTWSSQYTSISTLYTQSDGSFSFTFDNIRVSNYKLSFSKTNYITDDYIISPDLVQPGNEYKTTYNIHFESWLKIIIKNNTPAYTGDNLAFQLKAGSVNCPNGCDDAVHNYSGIIDSTHLCKIYGSQNAIIEWNYSYYSIHQRHIDTIWIQPADTTYYFINY